MTRPRRLSADEAAQLRLEIERVTDWLRTRYAMLPPPEPGEAGVARFTTRTRWRDDEIPELTVRATARLLDVSDSFVRTKAQQGVLEHRRTPKGHLRICGMSALHLWEQRNGPLPD